MALKLGGEGCHLISRDQSTHFPAYPVPAVDLTGAGDSFDGAIIYGFLQRLSLERLGTLANATGAAKVGKLGTGLNMPTADEIRAILDQFESGSMLRISDS